METIDVGPSRGRWGRSVLDDPRWTLFVGLVVLNIFDLMTTSMVINRGGSERNPFVQPFVESMWQLGFLKTLVLAVVATLLTRCRGSRIAGFALAATTGWYLAVVAWNVAVLTLI